MAETITIKLDLDDGGSTKSLAGLEQKLDGLKNKIKNVELGSAEFKKLQQEIVRTDTKLKNVNKSIEGMDYEQVAGEVGKLAGGVGAVTAAFVLLGGEGNETAEMLQKKMNQALGIFMGVKGAVEGITAATKLARVAQVALNTAMKSNPWGLILAAVAAVVAAVVAYAATMDDLSEKNKQWLDINKQLSTEYVKEKQKLDDLFDAVKNNEIGTKKRKDAVDSLLKIYPNYLDKQILEKGNLEDITKQQNLANTALRTGIALKIKQAERIRIQTEALNAQYEGEAKLREGLEAIGSTKAQQVIDDIHTSLNAFLGDVEKLGDLDEVEPYKIDQYRQAWENVVRGWDDVKQSGINLTPIFRDMFSARVEEIRQMNNLEDVYKNLITDTEILEDAYTDLSTSTKTATKDIRNYAEVTTKIIRRENVKKKDLLQDVLDYSKEQAIKTEEGQLKYLEQSYHQGEISKLRYEGEKTRIQKEWADKRQEIAEEELRKEIETFITYFDAAITIMNMVFDNSSKRRQEQLKDNLDSLTTNQEEELQIYKDKLENKKITEEQYKEKEEQLNKKYDIKEEQLRREAFNKEKNLQMLQTTINGAAAIIKTFATLGFPAGIPASIAMGAVTAAEIAIIASQKYAKGGVLEGPSHANGGILTPFGELEGGEGVINKNSMQNPTLRSMASSINQLGGGVAFPNTMDTSNQLINYEKLAGMINNKKVFVVSSDITTRQGTDTSISDRATF